MSPVILDRSEAPSATVRAGIPAPVPVVRPRTGLFKLIGEVLHHGGPGYLQFAITNICNAKCDFCGFAVDRFDPKKRRSVTLAEARDVIDICVKNHIGYLLFVGGEPLVHAAQRCRRVEHLGERAHRTGVAGAVGQRFARALDL